MAGSLLRQLGMHTSFRLLALIGLLAVGCSKDADVAKREFLAKGNRFALEGKTSEAIIEYKNALKRDPKFGDARLRLGDAYLKTDDVVNAYREYVRAADLLPTSVEAQVKAAKGALSVGFFEDAQTRAKAALTLDPKNVDGNLALANALARSNDPRGAIEQIEQSIRDNPNQISAYANLGAIRLQQGDKEEARRAYEKAVEIDPNSVIARIALANFYWMTGRIPDATSQLEKAAQLEPENLLVNKAMAYVLVGSGSPQRAEPFLKLVADKDPSRRGIISLSDFYRTVNRPREAKETLLRIPESAGDVYYAAQLRLAGLGMNAGDRDGAMKVVQDVLRKSPNNRDALIAKSEIELAQERLDDALRDSSRAVSVDPQFAPGHFVLGKVHEARHEWEKAETAFTEALRLDAKLYTADVELAKIALVKGDGVRAESWARSAIQKLPTYAEAHFLLARASLLLGKVDQGEKSLRVLESGGVTPAAVDAQFGALYLLKKDPRSAKAAFERALTKDATNFDALSGLVRLEFDNKRSDLALERLKAFIAANPKNSQALVLAGDAYALVNDQKSQEQMLRRAVEIDPDNIQAYTTLGRIFVVQKRLPEATDEFSRAAQRQPNNVGLQTAVAMLLHLQNKRTEAKAQYEKTVALDPRASLAANNLAWMYVEDGGNLDVALQLAQSATSQQPNNAVFNDTLGWIFQKKGLYGRAIPPLEQAAGADPKNGGYLYHLGMAYVGARQFTKAQESLRRAVTLGNFDDLADAQKTLSTLPAS